jgi:hypothetical protein
VWEALYTGLSFGICLAELMRHVTAATLQAKLRLHLTQLHLDLAAVLDCADLAALGIPEAELFHDADYTAGHALAAAARARGCEGVLIPSAARIPGADALVLVVFPDKLRVGSAIRIVRTVAPKLGTGGP